MHILHHYGARYSSDIFSIIVLSTELPILLRYCLLERWKNISLLTTETGCQHQQYYVDRQKQWKYRHNIRLWGTDRNTGCDGIDKSFLGARDSAVSWTGSEGLLFIVSSVPTYIVNHTLLLCLCTRYNSAAAWKHHWQQTNVHSYHSTVYIS